MCNPRRVMVHLTEAIEAAWRETVTRSAEATGEVQELTRITADIPLDAEMGDLALAMMERLMRGEYEEEYEAWEEDEEGNLRRQLDQVTLVYTPGSHQLVIEAQLTELISAQAEATAEAAGFTVGDVAVEAVGRYYDDGWGGHTEERARREAEAEAAQRLTTARDALHREQNAAELTEAEGEAGEEAAARAEAALEEARQETRAALRQRLQVIMADAQEDVYLTMQRLVGEAYRLSLIEMVLQNGGRVISDERNGAVINLELEL